MFPALLGVLVALSLGSVTEANAQTREDEIAIRQAVDTMTEAFNTRNDQLTASVITPDADFVTITGKWSKGPAQYFEARRARFATVLKNASLRVIDIRIRFVRPDVALAHVTYETRGMLDDAGKEMPPQRELNLRVFVKENGKWLMTAFHNTTVSVSTASIVK
jgi:uncharacterized protein (TIGR02246 family)